MSPTPATAVRRAERPLRGTCRVPADKSISHRAAILAAVAEGESEVVGYSPAGDCGSTLDVLRELGVAVRAREGVLTVRGRGFDGLTRPPAPLDCGRSGTTMRLLAGVLAGAGLDGVLTGHPQLLGRPMARVADPLRRMGADVELAGGDRAPITIRSGTALHGIEHRTPVASAQVKSAILLAGLRAEGVTTVAEAFPTRDHTERLLRAMGARIEVDGGAVSLRASDLSPILLSVPGDPSSAAPLLAAAALVPGSEIVVEAAGLNPGRLGFLRALQRMGGAVEIEPAGEAVEPLGAIRVRSAPLAGAAFGPADVPGMIDELPLIGVLATQAEGETVVTGAEELRVKESDRITGLVEGLRLLGADAEELADGFVVRGPAPLRRGRPDTRRDHRLIMAFAVAGLVADGPVVLGDADFVGDSFPGFGETLEGLR